MSRWLQANYKREADVTTDLKRAVKWLKDNISDLPGDFRQKFITDPWNAAEEFLLDTESRDYSPMKRSKLKEFKDTFEGISFPEDANELEGDFTDNTDTVTSYGVIDEMFPKKIIPVGSNQVFVKDIVMVHNDDYNDVEKNSKEYKEEDNNKDRFNELGDKEIRNEVVCYYKADLSEFHGDITNAPEGAIYANDPKYFYWGKTNLDDDNAASIYDFREKSKYKVIEY